LEHLFREDFGFKFTDWFFFEFFINMLSSGNRNAMKYMATWIPEIATVRFNQYLQDKGAREHFSDIVTMDQDKKILHLVYRGSTGEAAPVERFLESAIAVKENLINSGDIGGVIYVSPENFSDEAMTFFHRNIKTKNYDVIFGITAIKPGRPGLFPKTGRQTEAASGLGDTIKFFLHRLFDMDVKKVSDAGSD